MIIIVKEKSSNMYRSKIIKIVIIIFRPLYKPYPLQTNITPMANI